MKLLDMKNKSKLPLILSLAAVLFLIVGTALYAATGVTNYTANKLDLGVILFAAFAAVVSLASVIFDFKLVKHGAFLLALAAFLTYIVFEIDYIGSVLVGIDNTPVTLPFVLTAASFLAALILTLVAALKTGDPFERAKEEKAI